MSISIKPSKLIVERFRNFRGVEIPLGRYITVISGQNGVGKSNVLSLIASGSGVSKQSRVVGGNFQPEFTEFFNIDASEPYEDYKVFLKYSDGKKDVISKHLTFKDDTSTERGIRIIPRTTNYLTDYEKRKNAEDAAKDEYNVGAAARVKIPTIYLSLSRLYPLGEGYNSVQVKNVAKRNSLYQHKANEKYKEWYNVVIPNSVGNDSELKIINKKASSRKSLHMDIADTPTLSQSVGQDNVGNIISSLVDIYLLSEASDYGGSLLCIDEIDVSLHPDTQIRLIRLMESLSSELNIQFIVSSHSLTVLKEMLKMEKKDSDLFKVVYIKDPAVPTVATIKDYDLLKADLFGSMRVSKPRVKTYFEDDIGEWLFKLLTSSYRTILRTVEENPDGQVLRNANGAYYRSINQRIIKYKAIASIEDCITKTPVYLGCEDLIRIEAADRYFERVLIILDGDARYKKTEHRPMIRDYLTEPYTGTIVENGEEIKLNDRDHKPNVCFFPGYFAPESYLYGIIYRITSNAIEYSDFWHGLDEHEDTALFTTNKIMSLFESLKGDFDNDDLKRIIGNPQEEKDALVFIQKSEMLSYYYSDYRTIEELLDFISDVAEGFKMCESHTLANRFV